MSDQGTSQLPRTLTEKDLFVPPIDDLVKVLKATLEANYKHVEVSYEEVPDLTAKPWSLAAKGLCGHPRILDIGGVINMDFPINHKPLRAWDIAEAAKRSELPNGFFLGAAGGSPEVAGDNCELMPNTNIGTHVCRTKSAEVSKPDGTCVLKDYNSNVVGCLCNLYGCDGLPGKSIKVHVKERFGNDSSLISCMRKGLIKHYGEKPVALGGVFQLLKGTIKSHVMPCFPKEDITNQQRTDAWLKYFHVEAPVTCLSVQVSQDMGLELRMEHTHFFSDRKDGGHYHYDTTPNEVEYLGYFMACEKLYRIDKAFLPAGFVSK